MREKRYKQKAAVGRVTAWSALLNHHYMREKSRSVCACVCSWVDGWDIRTTQVANKINQLTLQGTHPPTRSHKDG